MSWFMAKGLETRWPLRVFPIQTTQWFYERGMGKKNQYISDVIITVWWEKTPVHQWCHHAKCITEFLGVLELFFDSGVHLNLLILGSSICCRRSSTLLVWTKHLFYQPVTRMRMFWKAIQESLCWSYYIDSAVICAVKSKRLLFRINCA